MDYRKTALGALLLPGLLGAANVLHNSSFELGFPVNEIAVYAKKGTPVPEIKIEEGDAFHGKRSLSVEPKGTHFWELTLDAVPIPQKGDYTFSAYLKADKPTSVTLWITGNTHKVPTHRDCWYGKGLRINLTKEWKRYTLTFHADPKRNLYLYPQIRGTDFENPVKVFVDAVQCEAGKQPAAYVPCAPVEAAFDCNGVVMSNPGVNVWNFAAVSYDADTPFDAVLDNGKKLHLDLKKGVPYSEQMKLDFQRRGDILFGGRFTAGSVKDQIYPQSVTIVEKLPERKFDRNKFFLGINGAPDYSAYFKRVDIRGPMLWKDETETYLKTGKYSELDEYKHIAMAGFQMVRLHDNNCADWIGTEREKGKFFFETLDGHMNAMQKYRIEGLYRFEAFGYWIDGIPRNRLYSTPPWHLNENWFGKKNGTPGELCDYNHKKRNGYPAMQDWKDYVSAVVTHCKGKIRFYEIWNEPNLNLKDAKRYTEYMKAAYEIIHKIDPDAAVVGISTTGDYGADINGFVSQVGKHGGFQYLDAMSFHPYSAQLDTSSIPAEEQIAQMKQNIAVFRKNVPLWNDELYYIRSAKEETRYGRRVFEGDFHASNAIRRYVIDRNCGVIGELPLHLDKSKSPNIRLKFCAASTLITGRDYYNDRMSSTAAYWKFTGDAELVRPLDKLNANLNGALYQQKDGTQVAAIWCRDEDEAFRYTVPAGIKVYDYNGNEEKERSGKLTSIIRYFVGKNVDKVLPGLFVPATAWNVLAAHEIPGGVAVYTRSNVNQKQTVTLRLSGIDGTKKQFTLAPNRISALAISCDAARVPAKLAVISSDGNTSIKNEVMYFRHKYTKPGQTQKIGDNAGFSVNVTPGALEFTVSVKDQTRSVTKPEPWENDGIEIFLDADPHFRPDRPHYVPGTMRIFLNPAPKAGGKATASTLGNLKLADLKWSVTDTADGYCAKCAIPWRAMGLKGPSSVGLEFSVNDIVNGKRHSAFWSGKSDNYCNRFNFGRVLLPEN